MKFYEIENSNFPEDISFATVSIDGSYIIGIGTYPHQYFIYSLPTASFIVKRCSNDVYTQCEILSKDVVNSFVLLKNRRILDYHSQSGLIKSTKLPFQCFHTEYLETQSTIICAGLRKLAFCNTTGEIGNKITFNEEIMTFSKTNIDNNLLILTIGHFHLINIEEGKIMFQSKFPEYFEDFELDCFGDVRLHLIGQVTEKCKYLVLSITGRLIEITYKLNDKGIKISKDREVILNILSEIYEKDNSLTAGKEYEMISLVANELYLVVAIKSKVIIIDIETIEIVEVIDVEGNIKWIKSIEDSGTLLFGKYECNSVFVMNCAKIGMPKKWAKYINQ